MPPFDQQSHQIFAVTDFKVGDVDVELGAGYGLTPGSDGFITKAIIGYAFPVAGKTDEPNHAPMQAMFTKPAASLPGPSVPTRSARGDSEPSDVGGSVSSRSSHTRTGWDGWCPRRNAPVG